MGGGGEGAIEAPDHDMSNSVREEVAVVVVDIAVRLVLLLAKGGGI